MSPRLTSAIAVALAAGILLTGCGPTVSPRAARVKESATESAATVEKIDLVAMWDAAKPCPDNPTIPVPAAPGTGKVEQEFVVTEADIRNDLRKIHAPAESGVAARENVDKLRQGLTWLWWRLDLAQGHIDDDSDSAEGVVPVMHNVYNEFQRDRSRLEDALENGEPTGGNVGVGFTMVCDDDRD